MTWTPEKVKEREDAIEREHKAYMERMTSFWLPQIPTHVLQAEIDRRAEPVGARPLNGDDLLQLLVELPDPSSYQVLQVVRPIKEAVGREIYGCIFDVQVIDEGRMILLKSFPKEQ